jgi:hypothetical protein
MPCPFLTGNYLKSCTVSREVYVPSIFETGEYCTTKRYTMCPSYGKRPSEQYPISRQQLASGVR